MPAGPPDRHLEPPEVVRGLASGRPIRALWENGLGGLTFAIDDGGVGRVVKWSPLTSGIDLREEARRMSWAAGFTPVPEVLEVGIEPDATWLLTRAIPAESAVDATWTSRPATAVRAIGEGLRALHEALPVPECPFSWSAEDRVADALEHARAGKLDRSEWHEDHADWSEARVIREISAVPEVDRLVVCHGDACAPNTLIGADGRWCGHVDLGVLGVADRWADLAVATWSTQWNYGPGYEDLLLAAYGAEADGERTRYYRLLWDLSS
jgi:aminoglycoside phosphotransferase